MVSFATIHLGRSIAPVVLGEDTLKALGPFVQGQIRPTWVITVLLSDNSALNLTGASYTGVLYEPSISTRKTCAGSYATTTSASGIFTFSPAAGDSDTPGVWWWETKITISTADYFVRMPVIYEERFAA